MLLTHVHITRFNTLYGLSGPFLALTYDILILWHFENTRCRCKQIYPGDGIYLKVTFGNASFFNTELKIFNSPVKKKNTQGQ